MAKSPIKEVEIKKPEAKKKPGRQITPCPECGQTVGRSGGICKNPDCGYKYEPVVRRVRKYAESDNTTLRTLRFILMAGDVAKAADAVREVELNPTLEFIFACGGISEALDAIEAEAKVINKSVVGAEPPAPAKKPIKML